MKHIKLITKAVFLFLALCSTHAFAWGKEGHRVVALIAESDLHPNTRAQIRALLKNEGLTSLEQVATWADDIRGTEASKTSHAVHIPFSATTYQPDRDCSQKRKCVVFGINHYSNILTDTTKPSVERLAALKFIVHFVGDVHQPLHAIQESGGMEVTVDHHSYKLHKIWDTIAIRDMDISPKALERSLLASQPPQITQGTPEQWAMESHDIAKNFIYHHDAELASGQKPFIVHDTYTVEISGIIQDRLLLAGHRLGGLLNNLLEH